MQRNSLQRDSLAFDNAYEGTPTWEIGRPQPAVIRLLDAGLFEGSVLDVGCGTGEHARLLVARGHATTGIDFSARAIERARAHRADDDGRAPHFAVADVRSLSAEALGTFDTVLDVGCFHTLQPADRPGYAHSIGSVLRPGGHLLLLVWSDRNRFGYGPTRIRRRDIKDTFGEGWTIERLAPETLDTRLAQAQVHAWLAVIRRI